MARKRVLVTGGAGFIGPHRISHVLLRSELSNCRLSEDSCYGHKKNAKHTGQN